MCDVVVEGEIIDIEVFEKDLLNERQKGKLRNMFGDENFPIQSLTKYEIKVDDAFLGDLAKDTIEVVLTGGLDDAITKPKQKNEKVILFLDKKEGDDFYNSVDMEHSIFTVDENDKLYSYSNKKELAKYDYQKKRALCTEVERLGKKYKRHK